MSNVKCIGLVSAIGAAFCGGITYLDCQEKKNKAFEKFRKIAEANGGKIPSVPSKTAKGNSIGASYTTLEELNKKANTYIKADTVTASVWGAIMTGVSAGLGLLFKAKIK